MTKKDFEKMKKVADEVFVREKVDLKRSVITKDEIINLKILLNSNIDFETFIREC